ncbi:MAG: UDP-N-acetylmuramoyl-tripeptide--D-alanyl-D-alanine ligase [Flavobacteriaceae bacterium]|nr:UDP-N-acetylmuramoyl-tripeptide--D-alanyl-D-alanine ligase [Flavobacteriaceae bacterium]
MKIAELHQIFLSCKTVSTDTRTLPKDSLFFCLKGENFNGNTFAKKALEQGASYVVYDDEEYTPEHENAILVEDSLASLQALAQFHRKQFVIPVIGLTGSNGKTTSKELIKSVLEQNFEVVATKGNLNNHIGVPLSLLNIKKSTEIALIEMGANHLKEIAFLAQLAAPTMGYITNFGKAHLEGFGSLEGVIKGKSELYDYLKENKGTAIVNGDDQKQIQQSDGLNRYIFSFAKNAQNHLSNTVNEAGYCTVKTGDTTITSQLTGTYNFDNINAAVSIGKYFKIPLSKIQRGIAAYYPSNNRSQWIKTTKNNILLDAYNANPTSMSAAIKSFINVDAKAKLIILGDMLELGQYAQSEHQAIVDTIKESNIQDTILVGPLFGTTNAEGFKCFDNTESVKKHLVKQAIQDHTILIKGSRGIALEQLLDLL